MGLADMWGATVIGSGVPREPLSQPENYLCIYSVIQQPEH